MCREVLSPCLVNSSMACRVCGSELIRIVLLSMHEQCNSMLSSFIELLITVTIIVQCAIHDTT